MDSQKSNCCAVMYVCEVATDADKNNWCEFWEPDENRPDSTYHCKHYYDGECFNQEAHDNI